ncbi:DUF6497 family protein [Roseovarius azorensis]|nr:DUF6497 family protein [Roseovarius azorensis]
MVAMLAGLDLAQGAAAQDEALPLPSGLEARLQEVLTDRPGDGLVYRFRFVAEGFAVSEAVLADLSWLCESYALPRLSNIGPQPARVVISLADKPSEFGIYDPDVTQVFESFSLQGGACVWELF